MATQESQPRHLELPDYIRMLSKRKYFIGLVTAAAMLVGGLFAVSTPKTYLASALVLVRQQPEGFFWVTGQQANVVPTVAMQTYARMVQSSETATLTSERLAALPKETRIIASPLRCARRSR